MMLQVSVPSALNAPLSVELPLSKSIANRMLIMRYLANSAMSVPLSFSNDTRILEQLLQRIGSRQGKGVYNAEDAGTVFRFLAAVLAITPGEHLLTGTPRMLERPVKPLVDALNSLNASINYERKHGFPPLIIHGGKLRGQHVKLDASLSSQFASALMMIAPGMEQGIELELTGRVVSAPYLTLTATLMRMQGYEVVICDNIITVAPAPFLFNSPLSEGDWSSASYWFALSTLIPGKVIVFENLNKNSPQGDRCLTQLFEPLGIVSCWQGGQLHIVKKERAVSHFKADFTDCPDLLPSVAVSCAGMGISASLTGISTLRLKESDRIATLCENLNRLGFHAENRDDELKILPERNNEELSPMVHTNGDHRMAMAFSLLCAADSNIIIDMPDVVAKSYPDFWIHLRKAGFVLKEVHGF